MNVSEWMSGFDSVLRCPCELLTCLSGNSPRCNQKPVYPIMRVSTRPYYIGIFTVTFCFRPCVRPMTPACSPLFPPSHGWPVCRVAPTAPRQPAPRTPFEDWINRGQECGTEVYIYKHIYIYISRLRDDFICFLECFNFLVFEFLGV